MPKLPEGKTWITELSAFVTVLFSAYQGYKHGAINPADIGQIVISGYDFLSVFIPLVILSGRMVWKFAKKHAGKKDAE